MQRYFAYIRVSTVKQGERGSSLHEQRSAIEAFAQRNNLKITDWFEERETAAKEGRRMFVTMLARLSRGEADGIIIHKIDRGARNLRDWANLGEIIDRGVPVHFVHDNVDLQSRGGRLSADIQAVVAADYIRNLRDEVKKGFYGRLKQGLYPLPAPIGYLDRGGGKRKEQDPVSGPIMRQAFELYATNRMSLYDLQQELTRRGLRSKRGLPISVAGLSDALNNPFYMGIIRIKRTGKSFPGCHEPLVSKKMFDCVQAVLKGKAHARLIKHDFVFRRFIKCGFCGRHLSGEIHKARYVYYRCTKRACRGAIVTEQLVEETLRAAASLVQLSGQEFGDLGDLAREQLLTEQSDVAQARDQLNMHLARVDERLSRLTDALLDGVIAKDVFEERRLASLRDRQGLVDQLADTRSEQAAPQKVLDFLELPYIKELGSEITESFEKRQLAETISSNFVAEGKKLGIALKTPYLEIANWHTERNSGPYRCTARTRPRRLLDILIGVAKVATNGPIENSQSATRFVTDKGDRASMG